MYNEEKVCRPGITVQNCVFSEWVIKCCEGVEPPGRKMGEKKYIYIWIKTRAEGREGKRERKKRFPLSRWKGPEFYSTPRTHIHQMGSTQGLLAPPFLPLLFHPYMSLANTPRAFWPNVQTFSKITSAHHQASEFSSHSRHPWLKNEQRFCFLPFLKFFFFFSHYWTQIFCFFFSSSLSFLFSKISLIPSMNKKKKLI